MDALASLRERGRWTRASILSLLVREPGLTRSALGVRLGLTAQAVSVQVAEMAAAGWVGGEPLSVTPRGIQLLGEEVDALREATLRLREPLETFDVISAQASARIAAGQPVGLWMAEGDLVADPSRLGPSVGVADNDASEGDEVRVQGAQGVVDLVPGRVTVVRVPEPAAGGVAAVDLRRIEGTGPGEIVAALGTGAAILARRLGRLDIRFAAAEASLNAAQRGLDVRLYVSATQAADALRVLERGRIPVSIHDAPVNQARSRSRPTTPHRRR